MAEAGIRLAVPCAWRGASLLVTTSGGECGPQDSRGHVRVLQKDGPLHLVRPPPPEALGVSPLRRVGALLSGRR